MRLREAAVLVLLPVVLSAAASQPFCEASPEVWQEFKQLRLPDLHGQERQEAQKKIIQSLLAKHPDDLFIHLRYQQIFRGRTEADREALIDRYHKLADSHSGDVRYEFLYANVLVDKDTPRAIELAQKIIAAHPGFARAHLLLADIYFWGKFVDRQKARQQLDIFFEACPQTLDEQSLSLAEKYGGTELAAKLIPGLRQRLSNETNPDLLENWNTVWNLEFKAHPPGEHDQVRKRISSDVDRLRSAKPEDDANWLLFLKNGYHMAGDETAATREESRLLTEYPNSDEARQIADEKWHKAHPWPGSDEAKQQDCWRAALARAEEGLKKSPDSEAFLMDRFDALSNLDNAPVDQLVAAGDALLAILHRNHDIFGIPPIEMQVAQSYLKQKVRAGEAARLVEEGWASYREMNGPPLDRYSDDLRKGTAEDDAYLTRAAALILLDAAQQLRKPEIAKEAVEKVEALKPEKPAAKSLQFEVEAKWAELQGRKLDALLLYRAAIDARPAAPKSSKHDELAENMDRLWKELGGTDVSRKLLASKSTLAEAANDARWEKPDKEMKAWQLTDLNGKTWKLAALEGKTVLINVWASWCGPCKAEHPHLQKLYDRLKNDPKIEIVTFNVDDEIGNVAPYMKENKYTFPVLLAKEYADDLSVDSIPRNWIVNAKGKWEWQQIGFGNDEKWEDEMLAKVKVTK